MAVFGRFLALSLLAALATLPTARATDIIEPYYLAKAFTLG